MHRIRAYAISIALVGIVAGPLLEWPSGDSFPVSNYPMFSFGRTSSVASVAHAVGVSEDGTRDVLDPAALGTDEVMQSFETLRQAVRSGPEASAALCDDVAQRVEGQYARVQIVTDTYDGIRYFDGDKDPIRTSLHADCAVAP